MQFKIIHLVWKSLHGCAPDYITLLVNVHCPARNLCSSSRSLLKLSSSPRTVFFFFFFFFMVNVLLLAQAAPKCSNSLPDNIKSVNRLDSLKRNLKIFFFCKYLH